MVHLSAPDGGPCRKVRPVSYSMVNPGRVAKVRAAYASPSVLRWGGDDVPQVGDVVHVYCIDGDVRVAVIKVSDSGRILTLVAVA